MEGGDFAVTLPLDLINADSEILSYDGYLDVILRRMLWHRVEPKRTAGIRNPCGEYFHLDLTILGLRTNRESQSDWLAFKDGGSAQRNRKHGADGGS